MINELIDILKELRLSGFIEQIPEIDKEKISFQEKLFKLCKIESNRRHHVKVARKIKQASFPKIKTLSQLSYKKAPKLPKKVVNKLITCDFVNKKRNAIFVGDSGGGKTHLAIALGIESCKLEYSAKFYDASKLVNLLLQEYKYGDIEKYILKLKKTDVLIIDELGYIPFSKQGAELLFRVISERYETGSIIITSNLNFSKWTELFLDKRMTTALLDRLTHNATIIKYDWGSIRLNDSLEKDK